MYALRAEIRGVLIASGEEVRASEYAFSRSEGEALAKCVFRVESNTSRMAGTLEMRESTFLVVDFLIAFCCCGEFMNEFLID